MAQEDHVCDTGLALGLSIGGGGDSGHQVRRKETSSACAVEPSLTLSLPDDVSSGGNSRKATPSPPNSTVSSFSAAVKRERVDFGSFEEAEAAERVSSTAARAGDDDDDGGARKKLRLTKEQSALLEDRFKEHTTLNPKQKLALARQLNLRPRQVEVWFQNRRARTKLKQTEVDCEFLKRCCETLTEENRRLQRELQELRALKFAPPPPTLPPSHAAQHPAAAAVPVPSPFYMQLPAATLTICPSCERVGRETAPVAAVTAVTDGPKAATGPFAMPAPAKAHFFNPFTHPAAC